MGIHWVRLPGCLGLLLLHAFPIPSSYTHWWDVGNMTGLRSWRLQLDPARPLAVCDHPSPQSGFQPVNCKMEWDSGPLEAFQP